LGAQLFQVANVEANARRFFCRMAAIRIFGRRQAHKSAINDAPLLS
jgi:hypothetical protein